ncbi:hypothetical protein U0C82_14690 [Fulvimarina sp. 2208YS6-2-32]|uniref:Lipoprotein n=1 Tax=Fulvimarina uroteuthidis TaxID=3098149 RepID=A0ABU5I4R9_9HYPH|nr:hypothetical protein [Fulvimarina sp. 2208YS6-2-32]MDY8110387.1 hypothetical protein [Fulvimarina sp. 2208YS6-2-32]
MTLFSSALCRPAAVGLAILACAAVSGCSGPGGSPVFGAVFGLEDASVRPYRLGTIPEPEVAQGDRLVGAAANVPGQCIWQRSGSTRRFEANCPEDFAL